MIIGRDLMNKLGIIVNFNKRNLIRDNVIGPIWRYGDNAPKPILNTSE